MALPTPEIADAASLAARAPRLGALSPREVEIGTAWLDLRGCNSKATLGRARRVAETFGPCLSLEERAQLFVTVDSEQADAVAISMADALLGTLDPYDVRVAALRGESVLERIEEFLVAGCELRDDANPDRTVRNERRMPKSAMVAAPPSVLRDATEAGAKVVVSYTVDESTIRYAISGTYEPPSTSKLTFEFFRAHEVEAIIRDGRSPEELERLLRDHQPEDAEILLTSLDSGVKRLRVTASDEDSFRLAVQRCELLLLAGLPIQLHDLSLPVLETWSTSVPNEMLEFGCDVRNASDWMNR